MAEVSAGQIAAVRAFKRFDTGRIGALNEGLLASPFSLTEMRVLYELAHRAGLTAAALGDDLRLDAGYLSRILRRFQARGLIAKSASAKDGRARVLSLTKKGRATFDPYDRRSSDEVAAMLANLSPADRRRLVSAMATIERLLAPGLPSRGRVVLRAPRSGDLGWIVHRHGALYAAEYGWGARFEGLVARVVADFLEGHDPRRERCWIAERDGEILGRFFWRASPTGSPSCGSSSSSPRPAASASAGGSWRNASRSPAAAATAVSSCGRTRGSTRRVRFTRRPGSGW